MHYESKTLNEENLSPRSSTDHTYNPSHFLPQGAPGTGLPRRSSTKKASLFAWMTLQSIPEETIISPHILEFLEQTLEPIPSLLPKTSLSNPGKRLYDGLFIYQLWLLLIDIFLNIFRIYECNVLHG